MRKTRKIIALLLVFVLLASQPLALAKNEVTNTLPGNGSFLPINPAEPPREPSGGSTHQHDYRWSTIVKATCTSTGSQRGVCKDCGNTTTRTIGKAKHSYEWTVVVQATCLSDGEERGVCRECGYSRTDRIQKGQHNYGEWLVTLEPTDGMAGERIRTCQTCGLVETEIFYGDETLYPGIESREEDVMQLQQALTDAGYLNSRIDGDYGEVTAAAVRSFQQANGMNDDGIAWPSVQKLLLDEKTDAFEPGIGDGGESNPNIRLEVVTTVVDSPEVNSGFFVPGEVIQLQTTVNNVGSVSVMDVTVETSLPGVSVDPHPWLSFYESVQFNYNYTVTPEDAAARRIVLQSQVLYNEYDGIPGSQAAPDVIIPAGFHDGSVRITKTPVTSPANGQYYVEGERIAYLIQLDNNTNQTLYNVKVQDRLICGSGTFDSILCSGVKVEKNETKYLSFEHTVTSGDIRLGMVSNKASVLAFDSAGLPYTASSATVVVSTGDSEYYGVTYIEPPQPDKDDGSEEIYVDQKLDTSGTIALADGSAADNAYLSAVVSIPSATPSPAPFEYGGVFTPVEGIEPVETPVPAQKKQSSSLSNNKKQSIPLWLTVEGTPVDGRVLHGEYAASAALYQAQLSGEASCEMTLSADSDAEKGNQIIYIADLENSGIFSAVGSLFDFDADPAQTKVFFGPKNAQESYQIAALMRMNVSDEPFNLTNMTDLTNPAIYKVYQTALSMASVRLQNVEVAYDDDMLTLVVWDQAHNGQCLLIIARKQ